MMRSRLRRPRGFDAAERFRSSRAGRALRRRLIAASMPGDPSAFVVRAAGWGAAAAACGGLWIGWPGAVAGWVAAEAVVAAGVRTRTRRRAQRIDDAFPAMLDGLAAALRAGASLSMAFTDLDPPADLRDAVTSFNSAVATGSAVAGGLDVFAARAGTPQAHLVAAALRIGIESGGDLPRVLDVLADSSRDRTRLAREAHVASTQARLSAWVVASLPVGFLLMTGAASREQIDLLLHSAAGWGLLAAGGTLEIVGLIWMRRLAA